MEARQKTSGRTRRAPARKEGALIMTINQEDFGDLAVEVTKAGDNLHIDWKITRSYGDNSFDELIGQAKWDGCYDIRGQMHLCTHKHLIAALCWIETQRHALIEDAE